MVQDRVIRRKDSMTKMPELSVADVFTSLSLTSTKGEVLILPERVRGLYPSTKGTYVEMGDNDEDCTTVEGTVQEVAVKIVATINRRRQKEFDANVALDNVLTEEVDKLLDDEEDFPPRMRRSTKQ